MIFIILTKMFNSEKSKFWQGSRATTWKAIDYIMYEDACILQPRNSASRDNGVLGKLIVNYSSIQVSCEPVVSSLKSPKCINSVDICKCYKSGFCFRGFGVLFVCCCFFLEILFTKIPPGIEKFMHKYTETS